MHDVLFQREKVCRQYNCTLQPCMFRIAPNEGHKCYYLSVNKIRYSFTRCVKLLDISVKLHQVFDLQYMHQCNQAYTFIQRCCYDIVTSHDKISPALSVLHMKSGKQ